MKMKRPKFVLTVLVSLLIAFLMPVRAFADKGIEVTVDNGYRLTALCHYEPDQYAEITFVEMVQNQSPDTLRIPERIIAYNDTFPVTRFEFSNSYSYDVSPEVIDFGHCSYIGYRRSWSEVPTLFGQLREVIFNVPVDTLDCSFHSTYLTDVDLTNVRYLLSADYIREIENPHDVTFYYGLFENCRLLQSVKFSSETTTIPVRTFYRSNLQKADFPHVKVIEERAFAECRISSLTLASVDSIGESAF